MPLTKRAQVLVPVKADGEFAMQTILDKHEKTKQQLHGALMIFTRVLFVNSVRVDSINSPFPGVVQLT